jgi:hypothetical protein
MISLTPKHVASFWMKIKKIPNGCWEWQASLTHSGYGRFNIRSKTYRAHIVSYLLLKGEISKNKCVCHTCDNPRCVNPNHLWLGTMKDNVKDMILKGRQKRRGGKGISLRKESGKWRVRIMRNYSNILVGEFETEGEARIARDKALKEIKIASP